MLLIEILIGMAVMMLAGALIGLLPFFVGKYTGKPNLGRLGWKWSMISGLLCLHAFVAIGFTVAILVRDCDYYPAPSAAPAYVARNTMPATAPAAQGVALGLTCLSGPLKGRTYPVSTDGIMIGRDYDCAVRFDANTPGISRHHCSLRYQQGSLMLTDLSSAYGTYLSDGRKLPPQYPMAVGAGSRFCLGTQGNLFQIVIIN